MLSIICKMDYILLTFSRHCKDPVFIVNPLRNEGFLFITHEDIISYQEILKRETVISYNQ